MYVAGRSIGAREGLALDKMNRVWEIPKRKGNECIDRDQHQPTRLVTFSILNGELGYQDREEKELQGKKKK